MARERAENITIHIAVILTPPKCSCGFLAANSYVDLISFKAATRLRYSSASHSMFQLKVGLCHKVYKVSILFLRGLSERYFVADGASVRAK
jgi:hypothetical protein